MTIFLYKNRLSVKLKVENNSSHTVVFSINFINLKISDGQIQMNYNLTNLCKKKLCFIKVFLIYLNKMVKIQQTLIATSMQLSLMKMMTLF
jgi:hypothetical protein